VITMIDVATGARYSDRPKRKTGAQLTPDELAVIISAAGRAPSVHNTQPWRFAVQRGAIDLLADSHRQLRIADPDGRELLISCGAALYGMRLGVRKLGYLPAVELLPVPDDPALLARVTAAERATLTAAERELLAAMPHRHTHRGPFDPGPVPARLLDALLADAVDEGAKLTLIEDAGQLDVLASLALLAAGATRSSKVRQAERNQWARPAGDVERDGVSARSWSAARAAPAGAGVGLPLAGLRLPQRDFGQSGLLPAGGSPPAATAILTTPADTRQDWLAAGQALHRVLLRAATRWVFASLYTEPLEIPQIRERIRVLFGLDGVPQMLMQFGRANTAAATVRRPASELLTDAFAQAERRESSDQGP
jgi:nitroreductase